MNQDFLKISPNDNCAIALKEIKKGVASNDVTPLNDIPFGHKIALCDIKFGQDIIKYGYPIGHALTDIKKGEHIHSHNLKTNLSGKNEYEYNPHFNNEHSDGKCPMFKGYKREDGRVGIRNEIWVISTVGCVNKVAENIVSQAKDKYCDKCDGIFAFTHPYGCSQLGDDYKTTQKILSGLIKNGNAGGILIVSLGCENNNLKEFMPLLNGFDKSRIRTLVCQECSDEISEALSLIGELTDITKNDKRVELPLSEITVGFKCGGSDGFSGITANPLCGKFTDYFTQLGGKVILTEVPEMFGAETILMNRAKDKNTFDSSVKMINDFKDYYTSHNMPVYENPSPGNKEGGITTLEEKSLGCIQKGGNATVNGILSRGEQCKLSGLNLLSGPGNDLVSCTNLTASGANLIIFTTGRGTPFGAPVPTLKVSTNTDLYNRKGNWIDYNAGEILNGKSFEHSLTELTSKIISIANGETKTRNEVNGYRDIAIFKDGVTL